MIMATLSPLSKKGSLAGQAAVSVGNMGRGVQLVREWFPLTEVGEH